MTPLLNIKTRFYPHRCIVCDRVIDKDSFICGDCVPLILSYDEKKGCPVCGLPLSLCGCGKYLYYKKSAAPLFYKDNAASSVCRLKYNRRTDKVIGFSHLMYDALIKRDILKDIDLITFIPMRKLPQFKRGYNQAELLARELSKISGIACVSLLYKYFATDQQHTLGLIKRSGNVLGLFEPVKENMGMIPGKKILLVDDILTTGCTMNEAAKTLLIFGADEIYVSTAAQTGKKKNKTDKNK